MSIFDNDINVAHYESWFEKHPAVFRSEVNLLRSMLPDGVGFEVGIGTGIFAQELGLRMGNDPSNAMLRIANSRNLMTYQCKGDNLPFHDGYFDFVLMVTTICFPDDVVGTLKESFRVIRPGGHIVVGFIDKESCLGQSYLSPKKKSIFYRETKFYSFKDVQMFLKEAGFSVKKVRQTLFGNLENITEEQMSLEGSGEGGFVVVLAER